jgi:hypothetical protein
MSSRTPTTDDAEKTRASFEVHPPSDDLLERVSRELAFQIESAKIDGFVPVSRVDWVWRQYRKRAQRLLILIDPEYQPIDFQQKD